MDPRAIVHVVNLRDMIPSPPAPEADRISKSWTGDVDSARRQGAPLAFTRDMLDNDPAARFQPAPGYPRDLRSIGEDGAATVSFSVDVNGNVFNVAVTRASHSRFGEEALRAVRRWRFEPGLKDGKRVAFRMIQSFTFSLEE